jgi:hypothetical protein
MLADVGAYTFGYNQYLKPHRVKMAHDLISAYGMLDKMHVLVYVFSFLTKNAQMGSEASTDVCRNHDLVPYR